MHNEYQQFAERQERQEYFDRCVKVAVRHEIKRIINSATCFDCDNPLIVLETEDGGIAVKACIKCYGAVKAIGDPMRDFRSMESMVAMFGRYHKTA